MKEISIQQAICTSDGPDRFRILARSGDFLDEWLGDAERLCAGFGTPPPGVSVPPAVFAKPLGKEHVAVVQVAGLGSDPAAAGAPLGFRVLVIPRRAYADWLGDPFQVADRFPPPWHVRGDLPVLVWPDEPLPLRTVALVQEVLKRPDGPALLGASQALVDGAQVVFERPEADTSVIRGLWTLLPYSTRCELWPASLAFDNALAFDALVVPRALGTHFKVYLTEEQARDYPEGRYELNLQIAAEAGDQRELNALFNRRSRAQTWRFVWILLAVAAILAVAMRLFAP